MLSSSFQKPDANKCLINIFQDPATKYHGHYLQAQIISKFAIHKKFVLQVRDLGFIVRPRFHCETSVSLSQKVLVV